MSRMDARQGLMPSVLDRLIDPDSSGTVWRHGYGVEQLIEAVARDLEDLLNTRQSAIRVPPLYPETGRSIIGYGLPDLNSVSVASPAQCQEVARMIEDIIEQFEPRLRDVRASLLANPDSYQRAVRFHIEGRLCVEPAPEVAFETTLELSTGRARIEQTEPLA